jgi:uncharacterized protein YndB with AHSA1/START domain
MCAQTVKHPSYAVGMKYVLYAPPEKVFEALTKEGILSAWCDGGGKVGDKAGGDMEMFGGWVKGKVVAFDRKAKKLSYTWKPAEWDKKTEPSLVEYVIRPHAAGSEVILTHSGFPSQEEADKHRNGWTDYVFEPLNDYFTS